MTSTPSSYTVAGLDLLAEMRELESDWQGRLRTFRDEDGDIRPECYLDYDEAKADHGFEVADRLENWINRLAAALESATLQQ